MMTFDISNTLSTDNTDVMMTTMKASEISTCVCLAYIRSVNMWQNDITCDRDYPQDLRTQSRQ